MDILLKDGKIDLSSSDLQLAKDKDQHVVQRLYIRLNTHKDTWFLNLDLGIDYLNEVFGIKRTKQTVDVLIQNEILKDEFVNSIVSFSSTIVGGVYSCNFRVKTITLSTSKTIRLLTTNNGILISTSDGFVIGV